jgi:hypothetical protein
LRSPRILRNGVYPTGLEYYPKNYPWSGLETSSLMAWVGQATLTQILVVNSQHLDASVEVDGIKSELSGNAGQFTTNICVGPFWRRAAFSPPSPPSPAKGGRGIYLPLSDRQGGGKVKEEEKASFSLFYPPADRWQRTAGGQKLAVARLLLQCPLIQQHAPA